MSKFKVGDVVRLKDSYRTWHLGETVPTIGSEVTVQHLYSDNFAFMLYNKVWGCDYADAELVTDPETIGLVKYGEDYCAAYGDGFKDGNVALQIQLDESRAEGQRLTAEIEELKNGVSSVITERNIARNALERIHRNLGHLAFDIARDALKFMNECWQSEEATDTSK